VLLPVDWLLELAAWLMSVCSAALHWMSALPAAVWQQHAPPVSYPKLSGSVQNDPLNALSVAAFRS